MTNCFLCNDPHCLQAGIDGCWGVDCPGDISDFDTPEDESYPFDEDFDEDDED